MAHERFELVSTMTPKGDQPKAIEALVKGVEGGEGRQVRLGITGSGKTFTIANVIAKTQRPALIIAPNKTLAAQLYGEMKELFPNNAVEFFVSYYDYYQPEAYVPTSDTYIEKDAIINDKIDRMRHAATAALLSREDVIIVASVSCIYGIGSRDAYVEMLVMIEKGMTISRDVLLRKLVDVQYERNDYDFSRGTFRVRGDVVEVFPASEDRRPSASRCGATRSSESPRANPSAERSCASCPSTRSSRPRTTSRPKRSAAAPSRRSRSSSRSASRSSRTR